MVYLWSTTLLCRRLTSANQNAGEGAEPGSEGGGDDNDHGTVDPVPAEPVGRAQAQDEPASASGGGVDEGGNGDQSKVKSKVRVERSSPRRRREKALMRIPITFCCCLPCLVPSRKGRTASRERASARASKNLMKIG